MSKADNLEQMQSTVVDIATRKQFAGSGEPPDNGHMEARVEKLEDFAKDTGEKLSAMGERLARIETRMEGMAQSMATKAEMHDMKAELVKWIVGTAVALGSSAIVVMTFVLNNATPKAAPAATAHPPIIINIPAQIQPEPKR